MPYDARQIANWFIRRAAEDDRVLSIMSLLKLSYIAHGWHLEMNDGEPLYRNETEAWQYGPVIPAVYNSFRKQGISVNDPIAVGDNTPLSPDTVELLEQIYDIYGALEPFQLSDLTHIPGGPWDIARKSGGWYAHIPDELIHKHYREKRAQTEAANSAA